MLIINVQPSMNLQDCINSLGNYGGGTLELNPTSTYSFTDDLLVSTDVVINGNGAVFDFNGLNKGVKIIGTPEARIQNCSLRELTITNSTGIGAEIVYTDNPILSLFDNVLINNCATGISISNSTAPIFIGTFSNNGVNCIMDTVSSFETHFADFSNSTTGDGLIMIGCSSATIFDSSISGNLNYGVQMTDCDSIIFSCDAIYGNGLDGVKLVSGNSNIMFNGSDMSANGGYGVNIVDATTTKTTIVSNTSSTNVSGSVNNLGTSTLIRSNQGIVDN